jgi:hypothetical protein
MTQQFLQGKYVPSISEKLYGCRASEAVWMNIWHAANITQPG